MIGPNGKVLVGELPDPVYSRDFSITAASGRRKCPLREKSATFFEALCFLARGLRDSLGSRRFSFCPYYRLRLNRRLTVDYTREAFLRKCEAE
jgi:hypothetical protein